MEIIVLYLMLSSVVFAIVLIYSRGCGRAGERIAALILGATVGGILGVIISFAIDHTEYCQRQLLNCVIESVLFYIPGSILLGLILTAIVIRHISNRSIIPWRLR
jgi:drug/metabolite transporter (DMT)-like permease